MTALLVDTRCTHSFISRVAEKLVLYVKKTCPWCIEAKNYLDKKGYSYREIDVNASSAAFAEMQKLSGQGFVPTLVVGTKLLADFGSAELESFLKAESILPTN